MPEPGASVSDYRNVGDLEFEKFILFSPFGEKVDIGNLVAQFDVYQEFDHPFLRCELLMNDSSGLFHNLYGGFTGGELLVCSYRTKDDNAIWRSHCFVLYEATDRSAVSDKRTTYTISGASLESMNSTLHKISKSYGGETPIKISDIISDIVGGYLYTADVIRLLDQYAKDAGIPGKLKKTNIIEQTAGAQKWVCPYVSPAEAIALLTDEADNSKNIPWFTFYEDSAGFKFADVNTLSQKPAYTYFKYHPKNLGNENNDAVDNTANLDSYKITSWRINQDTNLMDAMEDGLFKSKSINIDILRRTWRENTFYYQNGHTGFSKLNNITTVGYAGDKHEPSVSVITTRAGQEGDSYFFDENVRPRRKPEFVAARRSYKAHLTSQEIEIEVPGDTGLNVGQTVHIEIPVASGLVDQLGVPDKTIRGKYLITALRHSMEPKTGGKFITILNLIKEIGIETSRYVSPNLEVEHVPSEGVTSVNTSNDGAGESQKNVTQEGVYTTPNSGAQ